MWKYSKVVRNNYNFLKRGFLLFEVMVTVAILSLGLVLVLRSFTVCLGASRLSQNYMQACLLLEEKMAELEMMGTSFAEIEPSSGNFSSPYEQFNWKIEKRALKEEEDLGLDEVTLNIFWPEARRKESITLTTYLRSE